MKKYLCIFRHSDAPVVLEGEEKDLQEFLEDMEGCTRLYSLPDIEEFPSNSFYLVEVIHPNLRQKWTVE